jgi:uncharacterized membrane protein
MIFNQSLVLPLIGLIFSETFSQFALEKMITTNNFIYLLLGCIGYVVVALLYFLVLKSGQKLAIANVIWNIGSSISVFIIGTFYFKQKISFKQLIGIALAIFAGLLLN